MEVVGSTVERFPLPSRPAMNPSAMAAAVARHQVTKQTNTMLTNEETKCNFFSETFPKRSSHVPLLHRWMLVALKKKWIFWQQNKVWWVHKEI